MPDVKVGMSISLIPGNCGEVCAKDAAQVLNTRIAVHEHRVECDMGDGDRKILQINAAPLEDKQGEFHGVVLLARDVTQLELLQQRGRRAKFHRLIGGSPVMQTLYTMIEHVGRVDTTVLITGESGTGKELVAEALHIESSRHDMPLIKVDCTAISEDLLESELFGHRKGSFTGANRDREGRILQADGGTLFLDEIGDISPRMQLRLLRFLQEKTFYPVGQDTPVKVDVRVIAATNAPLQQVVANGSFREDLYFRLRVVDISLPSLRERKEDLVLLANHFIDRFSKRIGLDITGISDQALEMLRNYYWPGNVRELEHVIERACVLCKGATISTEDLPRDIFKGNGQVRFVPTNGMTGGPILDSTSGQTESGEDVHESEYEKILRILRQTAGNKAMAARILGFDRSTLYRKLRTYDIDLTTF